VGKKYWVLRLRTQGGGSSYRWYNSLNIRKSWSCTIEIPEKVKRCETLFRNDQLSVRAFLYIIATCVNNHARELMNRFRSIVVDLTHTSIGPYRTAIVEMNYKIAPEIWKKIWRYHGILTKPPTVISLYPKHE